MLHPDTRRFAKRSAQKTNTDGLIKRCKYNSVRKQLDLTFQDEEKLNFFNQKLALSKKRSGRSTNTSVFSFLLDFFLDRSDESLLNNEKDSASPAPCSSMTSKERVGDQRNNADQYHPSLFVGEQEQISSLTTSLHMHSTVCHERLNVLSSCMNGHVFVVCFQCSAGHVVSWTSSSSFGEEFLVNDRLYLAYICSGMLPCQYKKNSEFACIGKMSDRFLDKRLPRFSAVVSFHRTHSLIRALAEEKALSERSGVEGISVMSDARHACRKNSYHTDHVTLGQKSHKVVDLQHVTKENDVCTQRHEKLGCDMMYDAMNTSGVSIDEHVHDRNVTVNKIIKQKGVRNVNERWHAGKSIKSGMQKLGQGTKQTSGKTWHPQLSDKVSAVRDHVYWSIDNCDGDKDRLRHLLDTCVPHFQNVHDQCDASSACRRANYIPSLTVITSPVAAELLTNFLHKHVVYKNAEDYAVPRDTYYVESFNNVCLVYLPKRIHIQSHVHYDMRMGLAVLDWNEHVDREATSHNDRQSAEHYRRRRGTRVLKKKSFGFVQDIWTSIIEQNMSDRPAEEDSLVSVEASENSSSDEEMDMLN